MRSPLLEFTEGLLTRHGALVDRAQDALVALVPPGVASTLEIPEFQRLTFGAHPTPGDAIAVDYDSPLLSRFEDLVGSIGRAAVVPAPELPLKRIDPEAALNDAITVANGIVRECRVETGQARYVGFFVEYELLADERVSGMLETWVNVTTRSVPGFGTADLLPGGAEGLAGGDSAGRAAPTEVAASIAQAWPLCGPLARSAVERRLQDALESLRRRRGRDFMRLQEYYGAIDGEIRRRVRRALAKQDARAAAAERSRLEATATAYLGRVAELVDRYRVRVRLQPIAALVCSMAVVHVTAKLLRRTASRTAMLSWNPIDRGIEPPSCEACTAGTSIVFLCDDRVHLLCPACHVTCPLCDRAYCRACHGQCPRRHERG